MCNGALLCECNLIQPFEVYALAGALPHARDAGYFSFNPHGAVRYSLNEGGFAWSFRPQKSQYLFVGSPIAIGTEVVTYRLKTSGASLVLLINGSSVVSI